MRQGNRADYQPSKMLSGELAVINDAEELHFSPKTGKSVRVATEKDVEELNDKIKNSNSGADEDVIKDAVNDFLEQNPPSGGATAEQIAQIEKNTQDISMLSGQIADLEQNGTGGTTNYTEVVNQYYEGTEVTAETEDEQRIIDAYQNMISECMGDYNKIPFLLQTDNHNYFPKNIYELCGKMMNFAQYSKVITLGDIASNYYTEKHLQSFVDAMKPFPIEKRIALAGNHDVWVGASDRTYINQSKLSTYLKNYTLKRKGTNGYGVVTDDYFNVKYLLISNYDKEEGEGGSRISTNQVNFIIEELSKNDGYDVVILSHEPISMNDSTTTSLLEAGVYKTMGNYFSFIPSRNGFISMLIARKTKGSGTYTDDEGIEHSYDFTNCNSELLCCFCGHTHVEGFDFINSELLSVAFGGINHASGKPIYFGYIDRKNRLLKYYRVAGDYSSVITVGLDKTSATNMTLDKSEISIDSGSTVALAPMFEPITAGNQRITWTSNNEAVATVVKGFVTGVSVGSATITAVSEDGNYTATCSVTVTEPSVEPEPDEPDEPTIPDEPEVTLSSISATYNGGNVYVGTELADLTGITVTATYSDGSTSNVTGYTLSGTISEGSNTITVTYNGKTTTFTVTGVAKVTNNLPSEYQEVEYLYTTNHTSASITTNTVFASGDKGLITVLFTGNLSNNQTYRDVCGAKSYAELGINKDKFNNWGGITLINPVVGTTAVSETVYDMEFEFTKAVPNLILMAYVGGGQTDEHKYGFAGRLYSAKFYRGETMIYNFVPCYRKADNVIGVYDTVTNVFCEGAGELFAGGDI